APTHRVRDEARCRAALLFGNQWAVINVYAHLISFRADQVNQLLAQGTVKKNTLRSDAYLSGVTECSPYKTVRGKFNVHIREHDRGVIPAQFEAMGQKPASAVFSDATTHADAASETDLVYARMLGQQAAGLSVTRDNIYDALRDARLLAKPRNL